MYLYRRSRKYRVLSLLLSAVMLLSLLSLSSCKEKEEEIVYYPSSYSENGLSVTAAPLVKNIENYKLTTVSVSLSGLVDTGIMSKISDDINLAVASAESATPPAYYGISRLVTEEALLSSVTVTVNTVSNFGNLLSLLLKKTMSYSSAGGEFVVCDSATLNYNLLDGNRLTLASLFDSGFDAYRKVGTLLSEKLSSLCLFDSSYENSLLPSCRLVSPFDGVGENTKFTFDSSGITFYFDYSTPSFYVDPSDFHSLKLDYTSELFSSLVIFASPPTLDIYESIATQRHLIEYPSDIKLDYRDTVNGMEISLLEIMPTNFASAAVRDRVSRLTPSLDDIASQATGTGNEYYSSYFYVNHIGKFMIVRLVEEDHSGMNSFSSDRLYVFDSATAENLSIGSLFIEGFDYKPVLARCILPEGSDSERSSLEASLAKAQILPRFDYFLVRVADSSGGTVNYKAYYSDIGYENLMIYN